MAKIAGVKLCQAYRRQYGCDFISALPTNLYGGRQLRPLNSHVVPALIARMHAAKVNNAAEVEIWGTGRSRREFLHVDDLADACVHLLKVYGDDAVDSANPWINVGCGADMTIAELAEQVRAVVGSRAGCATTPSAVDGTPQKLLDVSRLSALGWHADPARSGLAATSSLVPIRHPDAHWRQRRRPNGDVDPAARNDRLRPSRPGGRIAPETPMSRRPWQIVQTEVTVLMLN